MNRALILGGAGFVGAALAAELNRRGSEVCIVDDFSRGADDAALATLRRSVEVIQADLTEAKCYGLLPRDVDQVYLLAAIVGVRNVLRDPCLTLETNTSIAMNTGKWMPASARLFFSSTSEVYAQSVLTGMAPIPTPESVRCVVPDGTQPRFAYAVSKILGESLLTYWSQKRDFEYVIGRFHNVYGPRMGTDHVVPELIQRALRRTDPFPVYGAHQTRAFCYIGDAVNAVLALMDSDRAVRRIVHIGDETETRISDLASLILTEAEFSPRLTQLPAPPGSVDRRCPDTTLLRSLTGFRPGTDLRNGLSETFTWYRSAHAGVL